MDPTNRGPEEYGHEGAGDPPRPRPPRDSLAQDFGQHTPAPARTVRLVTGELLLTVNPVDGSEIEVCPPGERPARPEKLTAAARAEVARAAAPPARTGPARPEPPLLGRETERERLVRLLARGRSVRLTGPAGSGRTRLLDLVAEECADLAPDGVVRLSGVNRGPDDLLHDLFHAVHAAPLHRPGPDELRALLGQVGAVVVVDDLEFGGAGLDELLDATPECAFALSATPDVAAPSAASGVEDVLLGGLDRAGGLDLLARAVGRPLSEEEANWAGDLWFESEGLPLRFVQAGALLRQRDRLRAEVSACDEVGVFQEMSELPADQPYDAGPADDTADAVPLPSLAEGAAPAALLAARLSASARATLRLAVALGGELPHQAHLPALVGDTHADAALGELLDCALVSPAGPRYRLAAGVHSQLVAAGYADDIDAEVLAAAQHYAWWAGHPSVTPERVWAEADALLAALTVLVPLTAAPAQDERSTAVLLARTAAPAFAAGLHWNAWERALRAGGEASRLSGEVAEQAYFHHELGVLALCGDRLDRARAELETSIGLRAALADKRGTVAGRRALALVDDRAGTAPGLPTPVAGALGGPTAVLGPGTGTGPAVGEETPATRAEEPVSPSGAGPVTPTAFPVPRRADDPEVSTDRDAYGAPSRKARGGLRGFARRNLVAAGAGALLAAVLGTVVTLGATSNNENEPPADRVGVNPSASQGPGDDSLGADDGGDDDPGTPADPPTDPGRDGTLGTTDDSTPTASGSASGEPSDEPSGTQGSGGSSSPSESATTKPPSSSKPPTHTPKPPTGTSKPPTGSSPPPTETSEPPTGTPSTTPTTTDSASGPAPTATASGTAPTEEAGPTASDAVSGI
ncbi:ATP-binding protein [Streptomyces sp. NPDC091377]|uniref:ATP-binding protein n=1 Tax=Streptomyces sp. NPDC091377 TaxID=3365995 RepID=UPI0038196509